MDFKSKVVKFAVPFIALLMLCGGIFTVTGHEDSDAKSFDGISEDLPVAATIDIAPGFTYTYTLKFPADLIENDGLEVTVPVNTTGVTATPVKSISGETWGTLTMQFPSSIGVGQYDMVIKAYHAETDQTAYQYIVFNVLEGIVFTPDLPSYAINYVGKTVSFDVNVNTSFGNVTGVQIVGTSAFSLTSADIDTDPDHIGKKVTLTGTITEEMATAGYYDITLKATTDKTEWSTKTVRIYAAQELPDLQFMYGGYPTTAIAAIDGDPASVDINTPTLIEDANHTLEFIIPEAYQGILSIDKAARTLTLQSDNYCPFTDVTIIAKYTVDFGVSGASLTQTKIATLTIANENANLDFDLSTGSVLTYSGNAADKTVAATLNGSHSPVISWKVTDESGAEITGVSIAKDPSDFEDKKAIITVTGAAAPVESKTVKVTMETQLHKIITNTFTLSVEDVLTIGDMKNAGGVAIDKVSTFVGSSQAVSFDITGGSGNTLTVSDSGVYTINKVSESSVVLTGDAVHPNGSFTIKVTSAAGQEKTATFDAQVFSKISFTGSPTAEAVFYPGE